MTRLMLDQASMVVRERDGRRIRAMAGVMCLSGLLVLGVLGYVWLQVQRVRVTYELEGLRTLRAQIDERNRKLALELASLRAFARVDSAARKLGLTEPTPDQVRLAREFVVPTSPSGELALHAAPGPEPPTSSRARPSTP
jgi:cell division protein FtsL